MYAKIFAQIFDSSIADDYQVRHIFEDLLLLCNAEGVVDMTREAIARRTNVPLDLINRAIGVLEAPDPSSRTKGCDGRRLLPLDERGWGWKIVNYKMYREVKSELDRSRIIGSSTTGGYVYFLTHSDTSDSIKIGFSTNPWARANELASGSPTGAILLGTINGGKDTEALWHERFMGIRLSGEWFKKTPELMAEVNAVVNSSLRRVVTKKHRSLRKPQKQREKKMQKEEGIQGVQGAFDISVQAEKLAQLAAHGFYDLHGNEVPMSLRTAEFMAALEEWHAYKKEKKESYKPIGAKNLLLHLKTLGDAPFVIKCIGYSMGQNWAGVYAPRETQTEKQGASAPVFIQIRNLEEVIARHPANSESLFHSQNCTTEQKAELRDKRKKLAELKESQ